MNKVARIKNILTVLARLIFAATVFVVVPNAYSSERKISSLRTLQTSPASTPSRTSRIQIVIWTSGIHQDILKEICQGFNNSQSVYEATVIPDDGGPVHTIQKLVYKNCIKGGDPAGWFVSARCVMDRANTIYTHNFKKTIVSMDNRHCLSIDSAVMAFLVREQDTATRKQLEVNNPWQSVIDNNIQFTIARIGDASTAFISALDILRCWKDSQAKDSKASAKVSLKDFVTKLNVLCTLNTQTTTELVDDFIEHSTDSMKSVKCLYTYGDTAESIAQMSQRDSDKSKHLVAVYPKTSVKAERCFAVMMRNTRAKQREGANQFMQYLSTHYKKAKSYHPCLPPPGTTAIDPLPYFLPPKKRSDGTFEEEIDGNEVNFIWFTLLPISKGENAPGNIVPLSTTAKRF